MYIKAYLYNLRFNLKDLYCDLISIVDKKEVVLKDLVIGITNDVQ